MPYFLMQNSVITNNGDGGNEEYTDGFLFYADVKAKVDLNYNTIAGNDVIGPLIYNIGDEVTTSAVSSIIDEDNDLYFGFDGAYLLSECLLVKNKGGIILPPPADIQVGDAENGDYHLTADSPAIDFCGQMVEGDFDKDGNPRGFDDIKVDQFGTYDLGAYEYIGSDIIFKDGFE